MPPVRRLIPCVLALVFLGACAIPSTALAGPGFLKSIWGPFKFVPGEAGCPGPDRCNAFPYYDQLGADVFQFQILWNRVAPTRPANPSDPNDPAYHWSGDFQFAVDEGAARGIQLAVAIKGTPGWANGGRGSNVAPSNPSDYTSFLRAVAAKYPSIRHWMIWAEPTRAANFLPRGKAGARTYARILDASYATLKGISPANVVIGGMTFNGGNTPRWLKNMRLGKRGPPPRMDWYGHNPFDARVPRLRDKPIGSFRGLNDIDTLWTEIKRHYRGFRARRPTKLWLAEWTLQTDHPSYVFHFFVSKAKQAKRLKQGYRLARRAPYVQGMGWYQLIDYPPAPNNPNWGLLGYNGAPKPAYAAFQGLP